MRECAFTIVAKNYIGLGQILGQSLRQHNPDVDFRIFVSDELDGISPSSLPKEGCWAISHRHNGLTWPSSTISRSSVLPSSRSVLNMSFRWATTRPTISTPTSTSFRVSTPSARHWIRTAWPSRHRLRAYMPTIRASIPNGP